MRTIYFLFSLMFSLVFILPTQAQDKPNSKVSLWIGSYSGELPCSNCEQKKYKLSLNPDYTYREEIVFSGKSAKPIINYGKYSINRADVLKLNSKTDKEPSKEFMKHAKGLILLENDQAIDDKYALTKQNYVQSSARYSLETKKMLEGVLFYASGNKPGWDLEIRRDQTMSFQLGSEELIIPAGHQPIEIDDNTVEYKIVTEERELNITIQQGMCKIKGNKKVLQSKVIIDTRKTLELKFTHLEGCGNYVPDAALQTSWIVKSIYMNPFHGQNPPTVEFHLKGGSISGNTGCNSYSGTTDYGGNKIAVGQLMHTLMACPDSNDTEDVFLKVLNGKTFTYHFKDNDLILFENKIQVMELKKVEF